jgi:hypothetical protein
VALPQLTDEQRAAALEKAAAARRIRAELKDRLKRGGTNLQQVLKDAETDEVLGKEGKVRFPGTAGYIGGGSAAAAPIAADVMRLVMLKDPSSRPVASVRSLEARNDPTPQKPDRSPA